MAPSRSHIKCFQCKCTESLMWKQIGSNQQLCYTCFEANKNELESIVAGKSQNKRVVTRRKSTRCSTRNIAKNITSIAAINAQQNTVNSKSAASRINTRGRRNLNRRPPVKAPTTTATTTHVTSLFHKGSYVQIGDIVSLQNANYDTFYAQIRGLIIDSFCEKSAVITWLIPTQMSPPPNEKFDPSTYLIGPEEDHPRLLSCMNFIMHAPSDYYHNKNTPFPSLDNDDKYSFHKKKGGKGFIWTHLKT